jgi:hypothetical protein
MHENKLTVKDGLSKKQSSILHDVKTILEWSEATKTTGHLNVTPPKY